MSDTDPAFDLNELMSRSREELLILPREDLDRIIAHQRKYRMQREAGGKAKKVTGEAPAVDIKALMSQIQKPSAVKLPENKPKPLAKGGFVRRF
jgi:hypothetical protein